MSDRLTDDVLGALWAASLEDAALGQVTRVRSTTLGFLIDELRARRQADLSAEDIDVLEHARDNLADTDMFQWIDGPEQKNRALALIDRLLAQGGGR